MKGCLTARSQPEGTEQPETDPGVLQQEKQPDAAEGNVITDYDLDVDYEGSDPQNKPDSQEEKEENSDAEYAKMEIPHDETVCQRMMHCNILQRIQHVH